jgi:hypothetical protein
MFCTSLMENRIRQSKPDTTEGEDQSNISQNSAARKKSKEQT